MTKIQVIFLVILISSIFILGCRDNLKNEQETALIVEAGIIYTCDGQWICYTELGYAKCNGALNEPSIPYNEVCN